MKYALAILNYAERPECEMVVLIATDEMTRAVWSYIADIPRLTQHQGWHPVGLPGHVTELSVFGVRGCRLEGDYFTIERFADSAAAYSDGQPRRWQGDKHISVPVRPYVRRELDLYFKQFEVAEQ